MVDAPSPSAKKPDAAPVWLPVVAGALITPAGKCLMHQRPQGKMYAGLWEFPGGKVEASEKPVDSLVRELAEELGIAVPPAACRPALLAQQEPRAGLPAGTARPRRWKAGPSAGSRRTKRLAWRLPRWTATLPGACGRTLLRPAERAAAGVRDLIRQAAKRGLPSGCMVPKGRRSARTRSSAG